MSRLARDGIAYPSRETKFSGTNADREIFIFPVQLTACRTGNLTYPVEPYSCYMCDHTYMNAPAGVAQEEAHIFLLRCLPSFFIARRIQPSLSLVDREVEFCVPTT